MTSSTPDRCANCGAVFTTNDRFCSTCGATRTRPTDKRSSGRRGFWLIGAMSAFLAVVLGIVAFIYFTAPERHADAPLAHVVIHSRPTLAIDPGPPPTIFLGGGDQLLISRDKGATWQSNTTVSVVAAMGVSPNPPTVAYLAGPAFWRADAGAITPVQTDLPLGAIVAIAVDPDNQGRIYAISLPDGLLRSDNGGATWSRVGGNLPSDANSLVVGTSGSARLFVGTVGHGVFASADGQSWNNASGFVNGALPTKAVTAIAFDPRSGDQYVGPSGLTASGALYVGTDRGVFKSIDSGLSWSTMTFHHPTVALAVATDGSHLLLALDPNGDVYRSTDGGNTWGQ